MDSTNISRPDKLILFQDQGENERQKEDKAVALMYVTLCIPYLHKPKYHKHFERKLPKIQAQTRKRRLLLLW